MVFRIFEPQNYTKKQRHKAIHMAIITLTSDWGLKDHYLASVKGVLLSRMPEATLVDISHLIPPFDIGQASFILRNCWKSFPKGTVHIVGINTEASLQTPHVAIAIEGQYFVGADNGIFSLLFDRDPDIVIELDIPQDGTTFTFSTRDVFVKAAVHLARGKDIEDLGIPRTGLNVREHFRPVINENGITGKVIYIDRYENVFTNISKELFTKEVGNRKFVIELGYTRHKITRISESYGDVPEGEILALFSSTGLLQIAINQGNAAGLLGLALDHAIRIIFQRT